MAKLKNNVDVEALKADIEAMKNAKNEDEVKQIKAKYNDALTEMNDNKAKEEKKPAAKKATAPKAPKVVKEPTKKTAAEKKEPAKKEPTKKETAKKEPAKKAATAAKAAPKAEKKEAADKKERTYTGKYEVSVYPEGASYRLKASNGQILVVSELYTTRDGALKAIEAVKKNVEVGEIKVFADKHGNHKFQLKAKNHRVIAISANYSTEKRAQSAVESFKRFAMDAEIVDVDPEDSDFKLATPITVDYKNPKTGGKYVISVVDGDYSWDLKANNGQILAQAEGYTSKAGCLASIDSFKKNVVEGQFKCVKDKSENYQYKLYSPSGRVCVVGEAYPSKSSAESAAQSVVSYFADAEAVEEE